MHVQANSALSGSRDSLIRDVFAVSARGWTLGAARDEVHLLYAPVRSDVWVNSLCSEVLSQGELLQAERFAAVRDKALYLQRSAFRRYCGSLALDARVPLGQINFATSEAGHPFLAGQISSSASRRGFLTSRLNPARSIGCTASTIGRTEPSSASAVSNFTNLFGDSSYIVNNLRWIGYDLSCVVQTGSNFGTEVGQDNPCLVTAGSGTMIADDLSVINADHSSTSFRVSRTVIGANNFPGNFVVYPPQSGTGDNCLLVRGRPRRERTARLAELPDSAIGLARPEPGVEERRRTGGKIESQGQTKSRNHGPVLACSLVLHVRHDLFEFSSRGTPWCSRCIYSGHGFCSPP